MKATILLAFAAALLCATAQASSGDLQHNAGRAHLSIRAVAPGAIVVAAEGRRLGRALERDAVVIDNGGNNGGDGNNSSTSCSCGGVNCSSSGFSSPGCNITCQAPDQATCACGGCGGADGIDRENSCDCE